MRPNREGGGWQEEGRFPDLKARLEAFSSCKASATVLGGPLWNQAARYREGKTVISAGPTVPAPPLFSGPSRSPTPGLLRRTPPKQHGPHATYLYQYRLLFLGSRPVKRFKSTAARKGAKAH